MLPRLLILVLCGTLLSCRDTIEKYKRSSSGVSALDKKVLYDFRDPITPKLIDLTDAPEDLLALSRCTPVIQRVEGSFTYAAEPEAAYLWHCGESKKVIIYSAGKLQGSFDTAYSAIVASPDLNHDDKNELLLAGESVRDGERTREASLKTIEKGTLRSVEDFGIVYQDSCALFAGAGDAKKSALMAKGLSPFVEAVVISYLPRPGHEMPAFTAQRFRAPCPATGVVPTGWQPASPR